jgi:hypothetical protein
MWDVNGGQIGLFGHVGNDRRRRFVAALGEAPFIRRLCPKVDEFIRSPDPLHVHSPQTNNGLMIINDESLFFDGPELPEILCAALCALPSLYDSACACLLWYNDGVLLSPQEL